MSIVIQDALERALFSEKGIALTLASPKEAKRWRLRAYAFRRAQRRLNLKAGLELASEFDSLILSVVGNKLLIKVPRALEIEEL